MNRMNCILEASLDQRGEEDYTYDFKILQLKKRQLLSFSSKEIENYRNDFMKLRRLNSDFCVAELNDIPVEREGEYTVYELKKSGWNTLDAIKSFSINFDIPIQNFSHAGLKDRHAETSQLITIYGGAPRNFNQENLSLEYLGHSRRETKATDIAANRFTLVLRSLNELEEKSARNALPQIENTGIANYFDDQRFGSYIPGHPFIAEHWIKKEYEKALWLTFAEQNSFDDGEEREQKDILRDNWGDWKTCKQLLSRSHRRSIITFLDDRKDDFKGAWACVNADMRGLYLTAFQSHLWNLILNDYFHKVCTSDQLINFRLKPGEVSLPISLTAEQKKELHAAEIQLPSGRLKANNCPSYELIEQSLKNHGWTIKELTVRHPRDRFFPKAIRAAMIPVNELEWNFAEDELSPGESKLTVSFLLPRGCYATMLVKRLMLEADGD